MLKFDTGGSVKMKEYEKISNDIAIFEIANDAKSTQKLHNGTADCFRNLVVDYSTAVL